ncbi:hypothetical protein M405DRAFT_886212 [Rhizopogon salebrosus TDB-379]|nr:hypothetical protein M405DRAFT_886212 [Rhizopogon salebrosus TDB-379]
MSAVLWDKSERDARFVSDLSDDLKVAIALRSWERALELVEEGRAKVTSIPSSDLKAMWGWIKHTADWFLAGFVEHEMTSSFIDWAKQQIKLHCEMFRKQVYSSDAEQKTVEEALKVTPSRKLT